MMITCAMRIVAVEPMIVEVPMRAPVKGVHGLTRVQRSVLVRIATDAEIEGWGNVDPSPGYTLMSAGEIHTMIRVGAKPRRQRCHEPQRRACGDGSRGGRRL